MPLSQHLGPAAPAGWEGRRSSAVGQPWVGEPALDSGVVLVGCVSKVAFIKHIACWVAYVGIRLFERLETLWCLQQ